MAVAYDAGTSLNGSTPALTHSWAHTCTGTNRLLVVGVSVAATTSVSTITYAGVTLTKAGHIASAADRAEIWYLVAPATGSNTIVVTLVASARAILGATSWTAVYQITPVGTLATGTGTSTTALATAASETSGYVADTVATTQAPTVGAGQSERWNASNGFGGVGGGTGIYGAGSTEIGAASVAMTWTLAASADWAAAALPIKTSTGYGTGTALITGGGAVTATGGGPDYDFQVAITF